MPRLRSAWRSKDNKEGVWTAPVGARAFVGKIGKVTIDLKEMKKAEKAKENKLRAEAAHKKAMSD